MAVTKKGEGIVGFGIMTYYDTLANLDLMAVIPEYQGTGIAQQIVSWFEAVAITAGIINIEVQARAGNKKGIKFYQKLGYKIVNKVPRVYASETQIRMAKKLC